MLPGAKQLLTASGRNPYIRVANRAVGNERSGEGAGESERKNDGVGAGVSEPNAVTKLIHIRGHARVEVGPGFASHGAGGHGRSGPEGKTRNCIENETWAKIM